MGDDTLLVRAFLNRVTRRQAFPEARVEPWISHHIDEIGNLEHFLPKLSAEQGHHGGSPDK